MEENEIPHEIFHVVSRFPRNISCYITESGLPLGQCMAAAPLLSGDCNHHILYCLRDMALNYAKYDCHFCLSLHI